MEVVYCSKCKKAIPPGGPDEGRYFQLGDEILCPKCHRQLPAGAHTGATVATGHPPVDTLKPPSTRIGQAAKDQVAAGRPSTSRIGMAVKDSSRTPVKPPTRIGQAATDRHRPTSRLMPAAHAPQVRHSSARLQGAGSADSKLLKVVLVVGVIAGLLIAIAVLAMRSGPQKPPPAPVPHGPATPTPVRQPTQNVQTPQPQPQPQPVTPNEAKTSAKFVKRDTTTKGNWIGVYGADGYAFPKQPAHPPGYADFKPVGQNEYSWTEKRAPIDPADPRIPVSTTPGKKQPITAWHTFNDSKTPFHIEVTIKDDKTHRLALYAVNWDVKPRTQKVEILDGNTGNVLDAQSLTDDTEFKGGVYLVWDVRGRVTVRVTNTSGISAVLSGAFFGPCQ